MKLCLGVSTLYGVVFLMSKVICTPKAVVNSTLVEVYASAQLFIIRLRLIFSKSSQLRLASSKTQSFNDTV